MPTGDYDKTLESSESLALYEGSRFMRFIKETIAGFKYGTKTNPKVKGNTISYIDTMGRLITQEQTFVDGENDTKIERIVRRISTSAKTEAINSIEVIEKKKGTNNWFTRDIACIADESRYCVWCEVPNGGNLLAKNPNWFLQNLNR